MTDMPEKIWAWEIDNEAIPPNGYYATAEVDDCAEYTRSDIARKEALEAAAKILEGHAGMILHGDASERLRNAAESIRAMKREPK